MSPSLEYTQELLNLQQPPYDTEVYLGIFLKKSNENDNHEGELIGDGDNQEGELIGDGGIYHLRTEGEWPNLSYRFKKEFWNNGYATEFTRGFMEFWRSLPYESTTLRVRANSVDFVQDMSRVGERVYASVNINNVASQKVLEKAEFELFDVNMGEMGVTHWRKIIFFY